MTVPTATEAWTLLRELVKFDLLILEVRLKGENGINFIARLREDCFLQHLPVVIYTSVADQLVVKKALTLRIQNYLIKPYNDAAVYAEITKCLANPWRNLLFEEERSFCAQMGFPLTTLQEMRVRLGTEMDTLSSLLPLSNVEDRRKSIAESVDTLSGDAEATGYWGLVELLEKFKTSIEAERWTELPDFAEDLDLAKRLLFIQQHPEHLPEGFLSEQEKKEKEEAQERSHWLDTDVLVSGPITNKTALFSSLETLSACPVIDSVAASFSMYADGQASNLAHVADLVGKDPGLSTQVLIAVNKLERTDMNVVEDPKTAISLLGELRLNSLARTIPCVEERFLQIPPITWPHYWMFLMGVARLAEYTCRSLELKELEPLAYTAGLIHDIGKLLLLKLQPFALQAIVTHSRQFNIPLAEAEQRYLGMTTRELGHHYASISGLPAPYINVISWIDSPAGSPADSELVAAVSLARTLCLHNHVGFCGDTPKDQCPPLEDTPAWQILRERIFPSFNLRQFEAQAHAYSKEIRLELLGRIK